jgi:hypothetical protein
MRTGFWDVRWVRRYDTASDLNASSIFSMPSCCSVTCRNATLFLKSAIPEERMRELHFYSGHCIDKGLSKWNLGAQLPCWAGA